MSDVSAGLQQQSRVLFQDGEHQFIWLGSGDPQLEKGISSNQYLIVDEGKGMLLDPGGFHVFDRVFDNATQYVAPDQIEWLFLSHQDPDICASLVSWLEVRPGVEVIMSRLWDRFVRHLALPVDPEMRALEDEGGMTAMPSGAVVTYVPAHFLHSPGNFHVYDHRSKCLFTSDLGAGLVPDDDTELFVTDFDAHVKTMEGFHRRYMASNAALRVWVDRVRELDVEMICPQHGKLFVGEDVGRFLDWIEGLEVGMDHSRVGG